MARVTDLARDGWTIKALAKVMRRSPNGVRGMLRKVGIHTSRKNVTAELCLSIRKDALAILRGEARARHDSEWARAPDDRRHVGQASVARTAVERRRFKRAP
jgi:hypothetical protein